MSSEHRKDITSNLNPEIMDYLIEKLESRQKNLLKYANIFSTIDTFESFYQRRKDIYALFKHLEEDLHQTALAIKALVIQNKVLYNENMSTVNFEKKYNKLLQENNYLFKENFNYAQKFKELSNKIETPKRKINSSFIHAKKSSFNKYKPSNKKNIIKNNSNYLNNTKNKNINKKNIYSNEDIFNYALDLNDLEQLKNVKNIMKDMNNKKNKVKEMINEHFSSNQIQKNRINITVFYIV